LLAIAQVSGADSSGVPQTPRTSRVIHASCVLAREIRPGRRVSFGRLGSLPGSQIRERLVFQNRRPRSRCLRCRSWAPTFPERAPRASSWSVLPTLGCRLAILGRCPRGRHAPVAIKYVSNQNKDIEMRSDITCVLPVL